MTTVLFDNQSELLHDHVSIVCVPPLTDKEYYACGNTALLDAIGKTINVTKARLNAISEAERPGKVFFIITTYGLENASREFDKSIIKEMIGHQQKEHLWKFIFLGADMDAVSEGSVKADKKSKRKWFGYKIRRIDCAYSIANIMEDTTYGSEENKENNLESYLRHWSDSNGTNYVLFPIYG